jgi:hypothetical protein
VLSATAYLYCNGSAAGPGTKKLVSPAIANMTRFLMLITNEEALPLPSGMGLKNNNFSGSGPRTWSFLLSDSVE